MRNRILTIGALVLYLLWSGITTADESPNKTYWEVFRELVPTNYQGWILAGDSPKYTLIYAEPPPAYSLPEYQDLLHKTFRGFVSSRLERQAMGFNGLARDIIIELDYGFAGDEAKAFLKADLASLSEAVYGTTYGAETISLKDLLASPPAQVAPEPVQVNALEINDWLFRRKSPLVFISPETGVSGDLSTLFKARSTGRFIASDNSLIVLSLPLAKFDASMIAAARRFAIDSDFVLGGVVDDKQKMIALVARARQISTIDFPALRVEDIFNAMLTKDKEWAQSYDRTTPGAGRSRFDDGYVGDWAPSYLSADLLDTEFGALLNHADSILKSQSMANKVSYKGFQIEDLGNDPYPEGVFAELETKIGLTSLVFNFNTVGAGHWYKNDKGLRIYAMNTTGSFSVTYTPDETGRSSASESGKAISAAEVRYTNWFRNARSPQLVRTVQYMGIYQLFGEATGIQGNSLYPKRNQLFAKIGESLGQSVEFGLDACLDKDADEDAILVGLEFARLLYATAINFAGELPELPKSLTELKQRITEAATAIRYEANLSGSPYKAKITRARLLSEQRNAIVEKILPDLIKAEKLNAEFESNYSNYESHRTPVFQDGKHMGERIHYEFDQFTSSRIQSQFETDKSVIAAIEARLKADTDYIKRVDNELESLAQEIENFQEEFAANELLLGALKFVCNGEDNRFNNNVLERFAALSEPDKLPRENEFSLVTPTIVMSRQEGEESAEGGHNVGVREFKVEIDKTLAQGDFRFEGGKLHISGNDTQRIGDLSSRFAKFVDADPATQKRIYRQVIDTPGDRPTSRQELLRLDTEDPAFSMRTANSTRVAVSKGIESKKGVARFLVEHGRLYVETTMPDGRILKRPVISENATPEIIDAYSRQLGGEGRVVEVVLDPSLSHADVVAIVGSYKNSSPSLAGSAGGGGRWGGGSSGGGSGVTTRPGGGAPRMVLFIHKRSKRQDAIVSTPSGRVIVRLPVDKTADAVLKQLRTKIEQGAELVLEPRPVKQNGNGTVMQATKYEIRQNSPISGVLVARSQKPKGLIEQQLESFQGLFRRIFTKVKGGETYGDSAADFLIEVRKGVHEKDPNWEVVGRFEGMTFVLDFIKLGADSPALATR